MAYSWVGPVFFVALGTRLIFDPEIILNTLPQGLLLFLGFFIGQILSACLAVRYTGHFDWPSSWMFGVGMLSRAELAFVVMDIAYIQHSFIDTNAFYLLMLTTFLLNISVPISIRCWKYRFAVDL